MNILHKILFYLSNLIPGFLVLTIVYDFPLKLSTLYDKSVFIITMVFLGSSVLGFVGWVLYLNEVDLDKTGDVKKIIKSDDLSGKSTIYSMIYLVLFVYVIVVGGTTGIILFFVFVVIIGLLSSSSNMIFNPFLGTLGYRFYFMELHDGSTGYVIIRHSGGPRVLDGKSYSFTMMDDYFYYAHNW